jgi:glycosyltransferase involved in cell wall biosynthesis
MSARRLAMVIPDLAVGGLQAMALGLASALDRAAYETVFYTFDAEGPLLQTLQAQGMEHHHVPRNPGVDRPYARRLATNFLEHSIDLVHCHNVTALFHGARAAWRAGRMPCLFTEHDREMPAPWKHRVLHRWLAHRVTRTVAVSERLCRELVRYEGFPRARTASLVNGIPDPAEHFAGTREAAREALSWDDTPVVLAVGSLTGVKNHASLLRLFADLHGRLDGAVRLVIAGEGPLRRDIEASARDLLPDRAVTLLGNRTDVSRLLTAAHVFVLPSHREGLPLSLVEAHAMARPSVAYDVGGNGEVIVSGSTGTLVPYADEPAFVGALEEILTRPEQAEAWGQAARLRFEERFTHGRMLDAYVEIYEHLLPVGAC